LKASGVQGLSGSLAHTGGQGLSGRNLQNALSKMVEKQSSNHSMQRMRASGPRQLQFERPWRLARTADAAVRNQIMNTPQSDEA